MRFLRQGVAWCAAWLIGVIVLTGCQRQPPSAAPAKDGAAATAPQAAKRSITAERISPAQQDVLDRVLAAGGVVERPADSEPTLIDLASDRVSADDLLVQSLRVFPRLPRLRLAASNVAGDTVLTLLRGLPELRELLLQDVPLSDQELSTALAAMPCLERLTLRRLGGVTDRAIAALGRCEQLEVLALIEMNGITGASLVELRPLSALRAVDLRNCGNLRLDDFQLVLQLPQLADLKLGGPAVTDEVLSVIVQHPKLVALSIEDAEVSQNCLQCLAANRAFAERLRTLSFARCFALSDATLELLDQFPQLSSLTLRSAFVTGSFLAALDAAGKQPPPLIVLAVTSGFLDDDAVAHVPALFPHLRQLDLRGNAGITDKSEEVFHALADLQTLRLQDTGVSPGVVREAGDQAER